MRTRRPRLASVVRAAFPGFCFPPDVIVLAVRWYLRFALSYRDVEELLAGRGVEVDHVAIYRWVQRFTPLLAEAARPWHDTDRHANNHIEADHGRLKARLPPMRGLKQDRSARTVAAHRPCPTLRTLQAPRSIMWGRTHRLRRPSREQQ
jgi:transposase-like protein